METKEIVAELDRASGAITTEQLDDLIRAIDAHARTFVYGTGRSGLMLKALAMRLMQLGNTAFVVGETTTPSLQPGDVLIVASASGETASVVSAVEGALRQGVDVVAISGVGDSPLSRMVEPLIRIASATKRSTSQASVQPLGSLFEQMLLVVFDAAVLRLSRQSEGMGARMAARHASIE